MRLVIVRAVVLSVTLSGGAALLEACSGESGSGLADDAGAAPNGRSSSGSAGSSGTSGSSGSSGTSGSSGSSGDASTATDAAPDVTSSCNVPPFGSPAVDFTQNPSVGSVAVGGVIPEGTYDAVLAERSSNLGGFWRETLVVGPNNAFTRRRQIKPSTSSNTGPVSERAGTLAYEGTSVRFDATCGANDGVKLDSADSSSTPFSVVTEGGLPTIRYHAAGLEVLLRRRP